MGPGSGRAPLAGAPTPPPAAWGRARAAGRCRGPGQRCGTGAAGRASGAVGPPLEGGAPGGGGCARAGGNNAAASGCGGPGAARRFQSWDVTRTSTAFSKNVSGTMAPAD